MLTTASLAVERLELARQFADDICGLVPSEAVAVFGSTARGDATRHSDLDMLVVLAHAGDARKVSLLCRTTTEVTVSPVIHVWPSFERLRHDDWLFVRHLSDEGVPLWDPKDRLARHWRVSFPGHRAVIEEIRRHSAAIDRLQDVDRYGGDLLFPLAATYGLAKRIAMLANARAGVQIFNREKALHHVRRAHPRAGRRHATPGGTGAILRGHARHST